MKPYHCLEPLGNVAAIPMSAEGTTVHAAVRVGSVARNSKRRRGDAHVERTAVCLAIHLLASSLGIVAQTPEPEVLHQVRITPPVVAGAQLSSIAWEGGAWVAGGSRSTILRSDDGLQWLPQEANTEVCLRSIMSGNGTFLALTYCSTALISRDGIQWKLRRTPGLHVRSTAFGSGVFVGVGDAGTIVLSSDAVTWSTTAIGITESLLCVRYAAEQFVAVGAHGAIFNSVDGRHWIRQDSNTTQRLHGLAYGDGAWVAVGNHGSVVSSPDGVHWTPRESGTMESLQAVAFGGGTFLTVGWNGCVLASRDAQDWRSLPSSGANLCDVAYGCGCFVAVGQPHTILLVGRNL